MEIFKLYFKALALACICFSINAFAAEVPLTELTESVSFTQNGNKLNNLIDKALAKKIKSKEDYATLKRRYERAVRWFSEYPLDPEEAVFLKNKIVPLKDYVGYLSLQVKTGGLIFEEEEKTTTPVKRTLSEKEIEPVIEKEKSTPVKEIVKEAISTLSTLMTQVLSKSVVPVIQVELQDPEEFKESQKQERLLKETTKENAKETEESYGNTTLLRYIGY